MEKFNVWETIKLGTLKKVDDICMEFKKNGFVFLKLAHNMINEPSFKLSEVEKEIKLVIISVEELGFYRSTTYDEICNKAKEFGLKLCPNEVGPQFRLHRKNQLKGEYLRIAMEPIADPGEFLYIFYIAHDDDMLFLGANFIDNNHIWHTEDTFVFCLP
jgi:hypothetical protein